MKKVLNSKIFLILLTAITFTGVGIYAETKISADQVEYSNSNVKTALDNLYTIANATSNISSDIKTFLTTTNYNITLDDLFTSTNLYSNSTAMDNIISNSTYTNLILNDSNAIKALDNSDPIISTTTSKAFASSSFTGFPASNAFDNNSESYWGVAAGLSYKNQYLGYDFTTPVWVYKMVARVSAGKQDTDYVLEGSNDNSTYTVIKSGLHQSNSQITVIPDNYNQKYRYYRIRFLSSVAQSGDGNTIVSNLRFYAK